jgi:hypothetical protein
MSHLLETYSLQTGAKVSKPFIIKNFFPVPKKYITIHNSSGMGAKNYDHFQDVIDEILAKLKENGIEIVQIGGAEDLALNGCIHLQGRTNYHQTAYIIQNSLLHIGNDSFPVHIASAADKPIIALYSITTPKIAGPCFNSKEINDYKVFCFSPDYNGKKPSFNPNENPKTINTINFENIIQAIEKILNIDTGYNIKTIFKGDKYLARVIEFIPDTLLRPDFAGGSLINMRVDLCNGDIDENLIFANLKSRKFNIFLKNSKKIKNLHILPMLKENIANIFIDVTDETVDVEYISSLVNYGIKPAILYTGENEDYFNEIKINLINFNLNFIKYSPQKIKIEDIVKNNNIDNITFKTNRLILSSGKLYLSIASYLNGQSSNSNFEKLNEIKNYKDLDKELEFCYLYTKEDK